MNIKDERELVDKYKYGRYSRKVQRWRGASVGNLKGREADDVTGAEIQKEGNEEKMKIKEEP